MGAMDILENESRELIFLDGRQELRYPTAKGRALPTCDSYGQFFIFLPGKRTSAPPPPPRPTNRKGTWGEEGVRGKKAKNTPLNVYMYSRA